MSDLDQINAKLDRLTAVIEDLANQLRASEKPMTQTAFAKRVGLNRTTIGRQVRRGMILTKRGRIPPSELRKFGL